MAGIFILLYVLIMSMTVASLTLASLGYQESTKRINSLQFAKANGFNPLTNGSIIEMQTDVSGLLKGNGTSLQTAVLGLDYINPHGSGSSLTHLDASHISVGTCENIVDLTKLVNITDDQTINGLKMFSQDVKAPVFIPINSFGFFATDTGGVSGVSSTPDSATIPLNNLSTIAAKDFHVQITSAKSGFQYTGTITHEFLVTSSVVCFATATDSRKIWVGKNIISSPPVPSVYASFTIQTFSQTITYRDVISVDPNDILYVCAFFPTQPGMSNPSVNISILPKNS